jgi:CRP-like cAMP-binding protein
MDYIANGSNMLLSVLPHDARAAVQEIGQPVALAEGQTLECPGEPISHAYFVESGLVSVVATGLRGRASEVGLIGKEGVTGIAFVLGAGSSPNHTMVQSHGSAHRVPVGLLHRAMLAHEELSMCLLRYSYVLLIQASHTALSNGTGTLPQRLARWLLMAHDRLGVDDIRLTHQFLSMMLTVRRSGVTVALHALEGDHLIRSTRGVLRVLDRDGLIAAAAGLYGMPEAEYLRVMSPKDLGQPSEAPPELPSALTPLLGCVGWRGEKSTG